MAYFGAYAVYAAVNYKAIAALLKRLFGGKRGGRAAQPESEEGAKETAEISGAPPQAISETDTPDAERVDTNAVNTATENTGTVDTEKLAVAAQAGGDTVDADAVGDTEET